jgi:hypothetical protein
MLTHAPGSLDPRAPAIHHSTVLHEYGTEEVSSHLYASNCVCTAAVQAANCKLLLYGCNPSRAAPAADSSERSTHAATHCWVLQLQTANGMWQKQRLEVHTSNHHYLCHRCKHC